MPITKKSGRQELIVAHVDIGVADVVNGVAQAAIDVPPGAIVHSGEAVTTEAWNSTTTDTFDVGDAGNGARYLNDGNIRALGARVPLVPTGFVHQAGQPAITVTWASGGGTPTTGKTRLTVMYSVLGRAAFAHGLGS